MDSDVEITGTVQRQAWLAREVPPVEQLRADLWSVPVPMPDSPLRYVTAYVFALAGGGLGMVDTGWDSDDAWHSLQAGLRALGGDVSDVRGVLVTHMHGDHNGLSGRVRDASGAWVAMHPADAAIVRGMQDTDVTDWKFVEFDEVPQGPWSLYGDNNTFVQNRQKRADVVVRNTLSDTSRGPVREE